MRNEDDQLVAWVKQIAGEEMASHLAAISADNPGRIARAYQDLLGVTRQPPRELLKVTKTLSEQEEAAALQIDDLHFASMCPHHFLPYVGTAVLTYTPGKNIMGLGKIPRFIESHSRGFWLQEELTVDIVRVFVDLAEPRSVSLEMTAIHMCICARGPKSFGKTTTSYAWAV